jgi:hypothetical protein
MTIKRMTKNDMPMSFGAFKPVGHVVVGFPDDSKAEAAIQALHGAGFAPEDVLYFSAAEEGDQMDLMLERAGDFSGFGYEVTLMRKYQRLAHDGASWLIVYAPEDEPAARLATVVKAHGALLAERYRRLVIEDLL